MTISEIVATYMQMFHAGSKLDLSHAPAPEHRSSSYDMVFIDWTARPVAARAMRDEDAHLGRMVAEAARIARSLIAIATQDELVDQFLHARHVVAIGALRRFNWRLVDYRMVESPGAQYPFFVLVGKPHYDLRWDRSAPDHTVGALSGRDMRRLTRAPL